MQQEIARDLYQILATREDASDEEIKRAFRRAALVSHPDRNPGKAKTEERFKEANFAYSVLGNPERRRRYDHYREFMLLLSHWGIRSGNGQERFLEDLFLQAEIPALAQSLLASLRHTRLGKGRGSPPSLPGISLLLVARLLQSIVREVRSRRGSILLSKPLPSFSLHRARTRLHFLLRLLQAVLVPASGSERRTSSSSAEDAIFERADIDWPLVLTREEAAAGRLLRVSFLQDSRWARTDLRVPAGVEDGNRIRLRGSGNRIPGTGRRGDLYLRIAIQSER